MSGAPSSMQSANLRGAMLMTLSMAGFAVEDLFIKFGARSLSVGQVMAMMGFFGALGFAVLTWRRGERLFPREYVSRGMLIRCGFEVSGRLFYGLALALTTLSASSAIMQAAPLVVVAGAALVFGEKVGWRRWLAILVGFIGVMIILRPGSEGFTLYSLLAVAGMLGFSGRDLATRAAPKSLSNTQLGSLGFTMLGLAGVIILIVDGGLRLPDAHEAMMVLGATVFGVYGYHMLTGAMRTGDVSAVTPFRYTRLVFAIILAVIFLGETVDLATLLGGAIVVASGIYTLLRSRRIAAQA